MAKMIPIPTCTAAGPHNPNGKLYTVVYAQRGLRDLDYACDTCIAALSLKKGPELDLSGIQTCNVNGSNPSGAW